MAPGSNSPAESKNSEPQTKVLKTDRDLVKYRQARDAGEPRFSRAIPDTIDVDGVQRPTRNSEGRLIHPTIEGIRNFWRWFGSSRVVDEQGRPLVVYHGTPADFTAFDLRRASSGIDGTGFYFTSARYLAEDYAEGGNVMEAFVALSNPAPLEAVEEAQEQAVQDANAVRIGLPSRIQLVDPPLIGGPRALAPAVPGMPAHVAPRRPLYARHGIGHQVVHRDRMQADVVAQHPLPDHDKEAAQQGALGHARRAETQVVLIPR